MLCDVWVIRQPAQDSPGISISVLASVQNSDIRDHLIIDQVVDYELATSNAPQAGAVLISVFASEWKRNEEIKELIESGCQMGCSAGVTIIDISKVAAQVALRRSRPDDSAHGSARLTCRPLSADFLQNFLGALRANMTRSQIAQALVD